MQIIFVILNNILYNYNTDGGGCRLMKNIKMKMARVEKDMSQEELAKAVGATRQTIGMIESGNYNPTLKLATSICKVLGKTLDNLFWEE